MLRQITGIMTLLVTVGIGFSFLPSTNFFVLSEEATLPPIGWPTQIPTSTPRLTVLEQATYDDSMQNFGFYHPRLEQIAYYQATHPSSIFSIETANYIDQNGIQYFAVAAPTEGLVFNHSLLLFAKSASHVQLLLEISQPNIGMRGFEDINQNGIMDFVYWAGESAPCCPFIPIIIVEIQDNVQLIDISPQSTEVIPIGLLDIDEDGAYEVKGMELYLPPSPGGWSRQSYTSFVRWFKWNADQYIDVSAQQTEYYEREIEALLEQYAQYECNFRAIKSDEQGMGEYGWIYKILLNYYGLDRLEQGWERLLNVFNLEACNLNNADKQAFSQFKQMVELNNPLQ